MMVCWVGDTSPWPGVTRSTSRGTRSRVQERGDMAAYTDCVQCTVYSGKER